MEKVIYEDLGRIDYQEAWDYQTARHNEVKGEKWEIRHLPKEELDQIAKKHFLILCEHPPVYTLGKSGSLEHLLLNEEGLKQKGIDFYKINRGGDITFHGPGQIVGYPIFDMDGFYNDVHKYVRDLEEVIIRTLAEVGIESVREEGFTGVWLEATKSKPKRKICAIGVHMSRWVTLHGFAFNVNTDLNYFSYIVPCGIADKDKVVTSLEAELGKKVDIAEIKTILKKHFATLFGFEYKQDF